jgi:hypothetical protein
MTYLHVLTAPRTYNYLKFVTRGSLCSFYNTVVKAIRNVIICTIFLKLSKFKLITNVLTLDYLSTAP